MSFFKKLFGKKNTPEEPAIPEQALIVTTARAFESLEVIHALEDDLIKVIVGSNAGEFDGNEIAVDQSHAVFYMYGASADSLLAAVEPILRRHSIAQGATCVRRYGPAGDPKSRQTVTTI
jgi:septum formation topological specificity factor MinE